jgi:hypothetical protein
MASPAIQAKRWSWSPRSRSLNWKNLTWGRPDSPPSVLCSYCSAVIPEDYVPLIFSNSDGWTVRFCEKCMKETWGME